ncbi:MAG: sigma 54-interacting transcriptional regulator [Peptostreptococcaceae bacterium]|nr:sigma 54-interacting transcriptional regulator [Peptostreptococcaceae bacterium]
MNINDLKLKKIILIDVSLSMSDLLDTMNRNPADYVAVGTEDKIVGIIEKNDFYYQCMKRGNLADPALLFASNNFGLFKPGMNLEEEMKKVDSTNQYRLVAFEEVYNSSLMTGIIDYDVITRGFLDVIKNEIIRIYEEDRKNIKMGTTGDLKEGSNDLCAYLKHLYEIGVSNKELNICFENAPNSFDICDETGRTLRVNRMFETNVGINRTSVLGRNVRDLEMESVYKPSVAALVLTERRKISVIQKIINNKEVLVTGVPIYDEHGNLFRVMTDAMDLDELSALYTYLENKKKKIFFEKVDEQDIICESKVMKDIFEMLDKVKDVDSTILITGESGVGKGVIARYIHNSSMRKNEPMININCGAIPESLLESELFGYEAGAFTGANKVGKPGLIEVANKGTIFLDEIGEMSVNMQVKFLQVIQEKKFTRVGGVKPVDIDVRIIAATNKNLKTMVDLKEFRLDLYYRLNVINIYIPPLRERKEDIDSAARIFLRRYNKKHNKNVMIEESVLNKMKNHHWEGNMRQLENYMERNVLLNSSGFLDGQYNDGDLTYQENDISVHFEEIVEKGDSLNDMRNELEKIIFIQLHEKYKSSYKVAQRLNVSQTTAFRKLKQYVYDFRENS